MKNFLDITDIDIANQLKVEIDLLEHNSPIYTFTINSIPIQPVMYFGLLEDLSFCCQVKSGAIEIAKIIINDQEVMPIYQHLSAPPTSWVTQNWALDIPGPFYPWYHRITGQGWTA